MKSKPKGPPRRIGGWSKPDGRHATGFLINLYELQKEYQANSKSGKVMSLQQGFADGIELMLNCHKKGKKLIFIGNGGSAAIASHQAVDYSKNGGLRAIAFNDASLLTCFGNDCGYENIFSVSIKTFADPGDVLIAISSSGRSPNILNGVKMAQQMKCKIITLSGFDRDNPLRKMGDVNFYVPIRAYGLTEVSHLALVHAMLREIIYIHPGVHKQGY